jgi:hypothetical protein
MYDRPSFFDDDRDVNGCSFSFPAFEIKQRPHLLHCMFDSRVPWRDCRRIDHKFGVPPVRWYANYRTLQMARCMWSDDKVYLVLL